MQISEDLLKLSKEWRVEPFKLPFMATIPIAKADIVRFCIPFSLATKTPNITELYTVIDQADNVSIKYKVNNVDPLTIIVEGVAGKSGDSYKILYDFKFISEDLLLSNPDIEGYEWIGNYLEALIDSLSPPTKILADSPYAHRSIRMALPKSFFNTVKITSKGFRVINQLTATKVLVTSGKIIGTNGVSNFVDLTSRINELAIPTDLRVALENKVKLLRGANSYIARKESKEVIVGQYRLVSRLPKKLSVKSISSVLRVNNGSLYAINLSKEYSVELGDIIIRKVGNRLTVEQVTPIGYLIIIKNNILVCPTTTVLIGNVYRYLLNQIEKTGNIQKGNISEEKEGIESANNKISSFSEIKDSENMEGNSELSKSISDVLNLDF